MSEVEVKLIPVRNHEARLVQLAWTEPPKAEAEPRVDENGRAIVQPLKIHKRPVLPGLNFVDEEAVERSRAEDIPSLSVGFDPRTMPPRDAAKLASETTSGRALRMWREVEKRPIVIAAIDKRLAQPRTKAA